MCVNARDMCQQIKRLKVMRDNPVRKRTGYVPTNKRAESYEGKPCALTHGVCASK
jgi:hypothetical protein